MDSVLAQTHADWELLVLDDGSDDGTAEYLAALVREDPRVRTVALPHTGNLARLRNEGIARARGRWVAFLDSDDAWREDKLERQLAALRASPRARWSYTGRSLMDECGAPIPDARCRPWHPYEGWIARRLLVHEAM
ncbi:MAG TPA: glycosyltransferase family A protein, partial [Longimicrobiaceae bacterium]|nr:glycosyltransferase family A protein [Longimicrobiaceae bacterium]